MLLRIIEIAFQVYFLMIFARILGSWIPEFQNSRVMQFISFYTDPYLNLFRNIIPPLGMIDISPIIAIIGLRVIEYLLKTLILQIAS